MAPGLGIAAALVMQMQAAMPTTDVAFDELTAQQNRAAIDKLEELGVGDGFFVGTDVPYTYTPGPSSSWAIRRLPPAM